MKHIQIASLIAILCAFAPPRSAVAETNLIAQLRKGEEPIYAAGSFTLAPFASYRAHEVERLDGRVGGGLELSWFPVDHIAIAFETLSERIENSPWYDSFGEVGANFKGYLPLGRSGVAPYGFIGYTRDLIGHDNRMNAGAGLEYRYKRVGVFADGRWTHNFGEVGQALFRFGGAVNF